MLNISKISNPCNMFVMWWHSCEIYIFGKGPYCLFQNYIFVAKDLIAYFETAAIYNNFLDGGVYWNSECGKWAQKKFGSGIFTCKNFGSGKKIFLEVGNGPKVDLEVGNLP